MTNDYLGVAGAVALGLVAALVIADMVFGPETVTYFLADLWTSL